MGVKLVTGGAGFIGGHLVRRLLAAGESVRVWDNLSTGHRSNLEDVLGDIDFIEGTILDDSLMPRAIADVDTIFHLAAQASVPRSVEQPRDAHEINSTGTLNLLLAARDAGAKRFVFSASSAAYGDTPVLPKVESMPVSPMSPYAATKLVGEHYCRAFAEVYGLETVSLRYFNVFGPKQDPNSAYAAVIPAFVSRMVAGESPIVFGDGEQSRDFCFIDNVLDANLRAASTPGLKGEVLNVACGERVSLNTIIDRINAALGTDVKADYQPPRAGDVKHSLADISLAEQVIGYKPSVMFADGLTRAIDYYRSIA